MAHHHHVDAHNKIQYPTKLPPTINSASRHLTTVNKTQLVHGAEHHTTHNTPTQNSYINHITPIPKTHTLKLKHNTLQLSKTLLSPNMNCIQTWPEPIVRVQSLSQSGIKSIPDRYIKPPLLRPQTKPNPPTQHVNIPVIDLQHAFSSDGLLRTQTLISISNACREWGFFQVVNHGVSHELMRNAREIWREFFELPIEVKQEYANSPSTYEGYGSRLGVEKGAKLDWSDYFFLHYMPQQLRNPSKWPSLPLNCK